MIPSIYFIGTGTPQMRGILNEGGFILQTDRAVLFIDPGPGAIQCKLKLRQPDACVITAKERGHDSALINAKETVTESKKIAGIDIIKKESGWQFKTPDASISYITDNIKTSNFKEYQADVIIFYNHGQEEQILQKIKPKLAILTGYTKELHNKGPLYVAREIQQKTNVQTIAASDDLTVNLDSYSALAEQKGLSKFS